MLAVMYAQHAAALYGDDGAVKILDGRVHFCVFMSLHHSVRGQRRAGGDDCFESMHSLASYTYDTRYTCALMQACIRGCLLPTNDFSISHIQ
jgi:hypothetical protein